MPEHDLLLSKRDWSTALCVNSAVDQELIESQAYRHKAVHSDRGARATLEKRSFSRYGYSLFKLFAAVLDQALRDAVLHPNCNMHRNLRADAMAWIWNEDSETLLSFDTICEALGVPASKVRCKITTEVNQIFYRYIQHPQPPKLKTRRRPVTRKAAPPSSLEKWLDGQMWMLVEGHDFRCSIDEMVETLGRQRIPTKIVVDRDMVIVQSLRSRTDD